MHLQTISHNNKSICANIGIVCTKIQLGICPVSSPDFKLAKFPEKRKESLERRMRDTRIIQLILLQGIYAKENMNRETFAHYGWIIIVASVMAALLLTATPFGGFIGDAAINIFAGYKDTGDSILDKDHISDKEDEWEDVLFDGETFTATFITDGGTWEDGTTGNKTVDYDIKTICPMLK